MRWNTCSSIAPTRSNDHRWTKCGSGLARECGVSVAKSFTDTPHSRASPLPHCPVFTVSDAPNSGAYSYIVSI
ncbi:hypothetical protein DYL59_00020 [Pseudomonas kairouanensis]|uniref:Uncharacterized protein n=1 Tax=Pseudomonas kairouanensis TaxID=2293832 RepID=A0A4Z0B020_9PSED|nr:hypothetical protein DYL59_00020 [Pseudomonas kairouanensis]